MQGNPFFRHFSRSTPTKILRASRSFPLLFPRERQREREEKYGGRGGREKTFFSTERQCAISFCSCRVSARINRTPVAYFVENTFLTFMNHKSVLREQPVWVTRVLGNGRDTAGYKRAFIIREAVTLVLSIPTI